MPRCQCEVYDIHEDTYRNCKNSQKFIIYLNKPIKYCHRHANIHIKKYCIIIQKHYKSYRTRNKIKSLFINLPKDLQRKILFYIREPLYISKLHMKISFIISSKINLFLENVNHTSIFYYRTASLYHYLSPDEISTFCYLLNLTFKYHLVISKNLKKEMYNITNTLHKIYIQCNVDNTLYKNEWTSLLRHFNHLKTLNRI